MYRWIALVLASCVTGTGWAAGDHHHAGHDHRQRHVAERGAAVMPFDLERTTHVFRTTPWGGIQQVVADDPQATGQVEAVRRHLRQEAARFARGDFGDPAHIHGADMPGLARLRRHQGALTVEYAELPNGAQIRYRSDSPELLEALHAWFAAQLRDHGRHARSY